jgi:hypothetical protein
MFHCRKVTNKPVDFTNRMGQSSPFWSLPLSKIVGSNMAQREIQHMPPFFLGFNEKTIHKWGIAAIQQILIKTLHSLRKSVCTMHF